tara:strand:- start:389 stop:1570 length:1182 start_codon:yes stop_codon:yes gene_type:complete
MEAVQQVERLCATNHAMCAEPAIWAAAYEHVFGTTPEAVRRAHDEVFRGDAAARARRARALGALAHDNAEKKEFEGAAKDLLSFSTNKYQRQLLLDRMGEDSESGMRKRRQWEEKALAADLHFLHALIVERGFKLRDVRWQEPNRPPQFFPGVPDETRLRKAFREVLSSASNDHATYGPVADWDVSKVENMRMMFVDGDPWYGDVDLLRVHPVRVLDLSAWDVSGVISMENMFAQGGHAFEADLKAWDVSSVNNMAFMFYRCFKFDSDLSAWKVSTVTNMQSMFQEAHAFNSDLSRWDVSGVTDMQSMFQDAWAFNSGIYTQRYPTEYGPLAPDGRSRSISGWKVGKVEKMSYMFYKAGNFKQDISGWNVESAESFANFSSLKPEFEPKFLEL